VSQPRGITASAVVLFIGSSFIVIVAAFLNLRLLFDRHPFAFDEYLRVALAIILYGVGLWGIASGVGVLRLRAWARFSSVIFSAALLFFTLLGLSRVLLFPMAPSDVPEINTIIRATLATVSLVIAALAGWSLYYFSSDFVKGQFQSGAAPSRSDTSVSSARPPVIDLIAFYLLITVPLLLVPAAIHSPVFLGGYALIGGPATGMLIMLALVHLLGGIGLLRLRLWARTLCIYYFGFSAVNCILMLFPANQGRFQAAAQARFGVSPPADELLSWLALWLVLDAVIIRCLVKRKQAFVGRFGSIA